MKSAYKLIQLQKGRWCTADNDNIWHFFWRIKAPPKCLNLVGRALSNCLPTTPQLLDKQVPVLSLCPVCNEEAETILHSLIICSFAQQCWLIPFSRKQWNIGMDLKTWLWSIWQSESEQ